MSCISWLHVRGTLLENMTYRPRPGRESTRRGRHLDGDPAFALVLLDREGAELVSVAPQVSPRACGDPDHALRYRVGGTLPLHPAGTAYELRRHGRVLYRTTIASEPPRLTTPRCHHSANGVALRWDAAERCEHTHHALVAASVPAPTIGSARVTYDVVVRMESGRRITMARGLTTHAHAIDVSRMPCAGKGTLLVVASDGVRSTEVEGGSIDVPERPPTVHILSPAAGERVSYDQPVSVLGCCLDMSGEPSTPEPLRWSLDGEDVAAGALMMVLESLRAGPHRLVLRYGENTAGGAETAVDFDVAAPDAQYREWEGVIMG